MGIYDPNLNVVVDSQSHSQAAAFFGRQRLKGMGLQADWGEWILIWQDAQNVTLDLEKFQPWTDLNV
jgi:hypothetical protein